MRLGPEGGEGLSALTPPPAVPKTIPPTALCGLSPPKAGASLTLVLAEVEEVGFTLIAAVAAVMPLTVAGGGAILAPGLMEGRRGGREEEEEEEEEE